MSDLYPTLSLGGQTPVPNDLDQNIIVPPLQSFSQWSTSAGSNINDPLLGAQGYADYQRGHFFRTGELDDQVESSISQGLVGSLLNNGIVSEEEVQSEGFLSTLKPQKDAQTQTNLIRMAYGEEAGSTYFNNIQSEDGNKEELDKQLNRAKTLLVESGSLPFARVKDDKGVEKIIGGIGIEDRGKALDDSVRLGALDYSDAYRVMSGLKKGASENTTVFESIRQANLLREMNDILGSEDPADDIAQNALDNMRELVKQNDIKPDQDQSSAMGAVIGDFRKGLSSSYSRKNGFGEGAALNRYSDKEIKDTVELLAASEVNDRSEFKLYDEDAKNIRILGSGHVLAHPSLMQQRDRFERAISTDKRLSPNQVTSLRNQRKLFRQLTYEQYDKFLADTAATSDDWMAAKQAGRVSGASDTDVLDTFLADKRNYSSIKNRLGDVAATIPDSVIGLFASLGSVVFKSEGATNYLVENQMDRQRRREVASLFGDDFGWGMDLSNVVAPMVVDVSATLLLSSFTVGTGGVAYAAAKGSATSAAKLAVKNLSKVAAGRQFGDTAKDIALAAAARKELKGTAEKASFDGVQDALKAYNKAVGNKMFRKASYFPATFLPAANRSAGSTYATVYAAQPDNMTHEEKHDAALGYAMMAGTVTGLITTAFMGVGLGGFESAFLKGMTTKGMLAGLEKIGNLNAKGFGAKNFKADLLEVVEGQMKQSLKGRIGNNLKSYGIPAMSEALEEGLDEFVQTFIMDAALNEETPMIDRMMVGLHAASIGGVMGAGVVGVRSMMDRGRGARFERLQEQKIEQVIQELGETGSPLTQRFIEENRENLVQQLRTAARSREIIDVTPQDRSYLTKASNLYESFRAGNISEGEFIRLTGGTPQEFANNTYSSLSSEAAAKLRSDERIASEQLKKQITEQLNKKLLTQEEANTILEQGTSKTETTEERESQSGSLEGETLTESQLEERRTKAIEEEKQFVDSFGDLWMDKEESMEKGGGLTAEEHHQRYKENKAEAESIASFWGMETRVDYDPANKAKGAVRAEKTNEGMRLVINPWGMSRLTMGLSRGNAQHVIRFEAAHETIHHSAWRNLSKAEMDEIFASLPATQVNEIIDTYYEGKPESIANARALLAPDASPSQQRNMHHIVVDEFLRMKAQRLTKGFTSEEELAFYRDNPNFLRVFMRYLRSYVNRFNAMREKDSDNPVVGAALNRLAGEMARLKGGFEVNSIIKFDIDDPENSLNILATYIDDKPFVDTDPDKNIVVDQRESQAGGLDRGNFETDTGGIGYGSYTPLFELPFFKDGEYKGKSDSKYGMIRWFVDKFSGTLDPRVKRLVEQRRYIREAVEVDIELFKKNLEDIIKKDFNGNAPTALIQDVTGSRENITPETSDEFQADLRKEQQAIKAAEKLDRARKLTDEEVASVREAFVKKKRKEFTQRRSKAIEKLAKLQNFKGDPTQTDLVKHLLELRELTNELSLRIKSIVSNSDEHSEIGIAISDNLDIYLHKTYKLFTDKEYEKNVRESDNYENVRNAAGDFLLTQYKTLNPAGYKAARGSLTSKEFDPTFKEKLVNDYLDIQVTPKSKVASSNLIKGIPEHKKSIINLNIGALKKRKNPPKELRDLLGEASDDTGYNELLKTFSHLGLVSSHINFIQHLKDVGQTNGFIVEGKSTGEVRGDFSEESPSTKDMIFEQDSDESLKRLEITAGRDAGLINAAPFNDGKVYFVNKEMDEVVQDMLAPKTREVIQESEKAARTINRIGASLTGLSLGAKTLGSFGFYVRNIVSNVLFFGPSQGFIRADKMGKALVQERIRKKYLMMGKEEVSAFHRTMIGLGIGGNAIEARLIQDLITNPPSEEQIQRELLDNLEGLEKEVNKSKDIIDIASDKTPKAVKKFYNRLREMSQSVDTFYKIAYFMNELEVLQQARAKDPKGVDGKYGGMSDEQLMQDAARKVKATSQQYDQAPPIVQRLQETWLGVMFAPFVRFKVEVWRIAVNTISLIKEEKQSGNPVLIKRGKQRAYGFWGTTIGASAIAPIIVNALSGIGEEEDEALRDSMPEYLRSHSFFYIGKGDKLKSVDFTYLNPYAMIVDPLMRGLEQVWRGSPAEGGSALFKALVMEQYLDEQILAGAVSSALNNRDPETGLPIVEANDTVFEAFSKKLGFVFAEAYAPRTPTKFKEGLMKLTEGDPDVSDFITTPIGALVNELMPMKPYDIKLEQQLDRFLSERSGEYRRVGGLKNRMYTDDSLSEDMIRGFTDEDIEKRRRINAHLIKTFRGFKKLGLTDEQIYNQALNRGYGKRRMALLLNGFMERPALQTPFIKNMATKGDVHIERLRTYQNQLESYGRYIPVE